MTAATAERADRHHRVLRDGAYAVLALGMAGVAIVSVLRAAVRDGVATGRLFSSSDDAFYYFAIASRWARGEGSTFDGLQATNGYQPLWFWINALVFRASGDDTVAVVVVVVLTAGLWVAAVALARSTALALGAGWAGVVGVAATAVVTYRTWFAGMEFALAAVAALAAVRLLVRSRALEPSGPSPGAAVALGVVGAVAVLGRLDAAALVALVAVAVVAAARSRPPTARLLTGLALVGPTLLALATYLVLNASLFASAVPMSGRAKQLGTAGVPRWQDFGDFLALTLGGRVRFVGVLLVVGVVVALVLLRRSRTLRLPPAARAVTARLLLVLAAAQLVQLSYYAATSSWDLEAWYFWLAVPTTLLATVVLVQALPRPARLRGVGPALVAAAAVLVVLRAGVEEGRAPDPDPRRDAIAATVATARWVDASLPPDARLAMDDWAGAFGFTVDRPVLQTEGLVASRAYLDALARGQGGAFLADAGVEWFVKIGVRGEVGRDGDCSIYEDPVYGAGPTLRVRACDADLVHRTPGPARQQGDVRVWRVDPRTWDAPVARAGAAPADPP